MSVQGRLQPTVKVWPGEPRLQLAANALGGARGRVLLGRGQQHQDLVAGQLVTLGQRRDRPGDAAGRAALDQRQDPRAASVVTGHVRVGAHDQHARAVLDLEAQLDRARANRVDVGELARQQRPQERLGRLGRGALGRAQPLDLRRDDRRDEPQQHRIGRAARAHPQRPDRLVGDAQLVRLDAVAVGEDRLLVGARACGDGEHMARSIAEHEAGLECSGGGAHDLGDTRPGRDSVRDGVECLEVRVPRRSLRRRRHPAKCRPETRLSWRRARRRGRPLPRRRP